MADIKPETTEKEPETFHCYGLAASLEPGCGLLLELAGDTTWLSWEETKKLRNWLAEKAVNPPLTDAQHFARIIKLAEHIK